VSHEKKTAVLIPDELNRFFFDSRLSGRYGMGVPYPSDRFCIMPSFADPDPHHFGKVDPDPDQTVKLDQS
jgi:hypothetical protein